MFIVSDSVRLHVKTFGNKGNPVVVLCHSLGSDMSTWDLLVPALQDKYFIITPDMRGHGLSESGKQFSFKDLASDIINIIEELNISKVHFIGLSMGGMIAQAMGIYFPNHLQSLTIMASMSSSSNSREMWLDRVSSVEEGGLEPLVETTLQRWFTADAFKEQPDIIDKVRKLIPKTSIEGYKQACLAIADLDFTEHLHQITVPCQIIVGRQDEGTPPALSEIMHEMIDGSKLHLIEGAAHQVALERSEIVNPIVLEFLNQNS